MNEFIYPIFAIARDGKFFFVEESQQVMVLAGSVRRIERSEAVAGNCHWLCCGKIMSYNKIDYSKETFSFRDAYTDLNGAWYKYG